MNPQESYVSCNNNPLYKKFIDFKKQKLRDYNIKFKVLYNSENNQLTIYNLGLFHIIVKHAENFIEIKKNLSYSIPTSEINIFKFKF
jgi:hypothetical protein